METDENDTSGLDDLRDALRDELTRAAREEMARLRAEAAAGDAKAARILERLEKALARKRRTGPRRAGPRGA
jgi:hypothetical protein